MKRRQLGWHRNLLLAWALLGLSACSEPQPPKQPAQATTPQTRTVSVGSQQVAVPAEPKQIAVLWPPTLAAVTQLGFDPIGAVGDPGAHDGGLAPYAPPEYPLEEVTVIASLQDLQVKGVAALDPDLIIGADVEPFSQHREALSGIAPTVLLPWESSGWKQHFTQVATVLGAEQKAQEVVGTYETRLQEVRASLGARANQLQVSLLRLRSPERMLLATTASFPGGVLADLGLTQVPSQQQPEGGQAYLPAPHAQLPASDGDVMFVMHDNTGGQAAEAVAAATGNPNWQQLSAVQRNRDFDVDYEYWGSFSYLGALRILEDVQEALGQGAKSAA